VLSNGKATWRTRVWLWVRLVLAVGGAQERLMHWSGFGRDQCTYELNEEEIVSL